MTPTKGRPLPRRPRFPDWPERLAAAVEARTERPFAWGEHDCFLFAADVVLAVTGQDPAAAWRGRYASEEEAEALIASLGGREAALVAAMAQFGAPEIRPTFAQRGDLVLVTIGNDIACGVILDGDRVVAPGAERLLALPRRLVLRAWAV